MIREVADNFTSQKAALTATRLTMNMGRVRYVAVAVGMLLTILAVFTVVQRWPTESNTPILFPILTCLLLGGALTALLLLLFVRR